MDTVINPNLILLGASDYSIDEKGRISLPAEYRYRVTQGGLGPFVLTYGVGRSLTVFAIPEWEKILRNLQIPPEDTDAAEYEDYLRWVMTGTSFVQSDPQGRVRIPSNLLEFAELEGKATIFGMFNRLEIWAPAQLKNRFGGDPARFSKQHGQTLRGSTYQTIGAKPIPQSPFGGFDSMPFEG